MDEYTSLPCGAVVCFNHQEFHRHGFADPDKFDPERWKTIAMRDASFIPFGVAANRPCPAQAMAFTSMRAAVREVLRHSRLRSSARHTRSIPNRGPCLLIPRMDASARWGESAWLLWMRFRDRWEDVGRSFVHLVLGMYMVWHARQLRLCERYFENNENDRPGGTRAGVCPFARHSGGYRNVRRGACHTQEIASLFTRSSKPPTRGRSLTRSFVKTSSHAWLSKGWAG